MLDVSKALKVEIVQYKTSRSTVYTFLCSECEMGTLKCEKKLLSKQTGKCRWCVHKGVPYKSSYNHLKDSISRTNKRRKKQKSFELSFEEFLDFVKIKTCHYCNENIHWVKHTGSGQHKYNLDRKDSNIGYIKDNLVVCCKRCNLMKNVYFSYDEFKAVADFINNMRNGAFKKEVI